MIEITEYTTIEEWESRFLLEMIMARRLNMLPEHRKSHIVLPSKINVLLEAAMVEAASVQDSKDLSL